MNLNQHSTRLAVLSVLMGSSIALWAGTPVKITGSVKDSNGEPLIGATVAVQAHPRVPSPTSTVSSP